MPPLPPPPDLGGTIGDVTGLLGDVTSQPPADGGTDGGSGGGTGGGSGATTTGTSGTESSGGSVTSGAGGSVADAAVAPDVRPPRVTLKLASSFAWIARTGRLKARVTTDEPGSVRVGGTLRVGHEVLRLTPAAADYRAAGAKTLTIKLTRATLRRLARARSVRLSLHAVGVDAARNRALTSLKRTLTRPREVAHLRHHRRRAAQRAVEAPR